MNEINLLIFYIQIIFKKPASGGESSLHVGYDNGGRYIEFNNTFNNKSFLCSPCFSLKSRVGICGLIFFDSIFFQDGTFQTFLIFPIVFLYIRKTLFYNRKHLSIYNFFFKWQKKLPYLFTIKSEIINMVAPWN